MVASCFGSTVSIIQPFQMVDRLRWEHMSIKFKSGIAAFLIYFAFVFQKLMIRKLGLDQAAQQQNWSSTHKDRVRLVLTADYMSSESSAEESDCDESGTIVSGSFMRVKKIIWLKNKYRDSFHAIDKAYYSSHKRSRDKLKRRVQHGSSTRSQPLNAPRLL